MFAMGSINIEDMFGTMASKTYSLCDLIEGRFQNLMENENEPELLTPSLYYDNNSFIEILKSKQGKFKILSLNCQSLNAKFNQLKIYIEDYRHSGDQIDMICLQETWLHNDSELSLLHIPGYQLISKGKSCSAHGGVAIYLSEKYTFTILNLSDSQSNSWDGLFLEVYVRNSSLRSCTDKIIVGNIYKPPRNNVDTLVSFIDELHQILTKLNRKKNVIITGDFNLDLLKYQQNSHINDFLELFFQCSYIPKITLPTRLTQQHGTLIDNFFTKLNDGFTSTTTGIILNAISDHQPYFIILDNLNFTVKRNKYISVKRNYDDALYGLKEELKMCCHIENFDLSPNADPHYNYNRFDEILTNSISKHFQKRIVKCNKYKHKLSSWITNGIIKSISFRDKLYHKLKTLNENHPNFPGIKSNLQAYNTILIRNP
jgi:hypothetical protein